MLLSLNITALFTDFGDHLIQIKPIADICNVSNNYLQQGGCVFTLVHLLGLHKTY